MMMTTRPAPAVTIDAKYATLHQILVDCGSVCIGYSGGVDSVLLAKAALDTLGADRVLAVTGRSAAYPAAQREVAVECANRFGIPHLEVDTDELDDPNYAANPGNRCYFCKAELWPKLRAVAAARGLREVLDGSNADDAHDYRPGFGAARENGVRSPLLEASLTKDDVRELSRRLGLPTWDQPASPCLSSRLPYGVAVTRERLHQVEVAEAALRARGYREFRVRHHGDCARVEFAPDELDAAWRDMRGIGNALYAVGLERVLLDVDGYRRGALNEVLVQLGGAAGGTAACNAAAVLDHPAAHGVAAHDDVAHDGVRVPHDIAAHHDVARHYDAALADRGAESGLVPGPAGQHGDIAVLRAAPLTELRAYATHLRALGFRFIAVDAGE
jgi:pyridinium-3,5-biscarboxylic acid mononucleotide sulfurtransferase